MKLFSRQIKEDDSLTAKNLYCPLCDEKMNSYWHSINIPLMDALKKLYEAGGVAHLRDLDLTFSQKTNFQKLHYFDLATTDGSGEYTITNTGVDFILGKIKIPKKIRTYRNEIVEKSDEIAGVKDVDSGFKCPADYSLQAEIVPGPKMDSQTEIKFKDNDEKK